MTTANGSPMFGMPIGSQGMPIGSQLGMPIGTQLGRDMNPAMSQPLGVPSTVSSLSVSPIPVGTQVSSVSVSPMPVGTQGMPVGTQVYSPEPVLSGAPTFDQMWPKEAFKDNRDPELLRLTTDELKERYIQNDDIIRDLHEDLNRPQSQEERLWRLERQFLPLFPGNELRVHAPVLKKIKEAVLDSHEIDHQRELEELREQSRDEYWTNNCPVKYLHPSADSLVLGRSHMPLDRTYEAQEEFMQNLEDKRHPVVEEVRYAGHAAKPEEHAECVFVKEEGILKRQPVYPVPYRNDFWLNLDGHTRNDLERHRDAVHKMMEDPVAQRVARKDTVGTGEDALPVDWKGQLKRGVPMPRQGPAQSDGFVMPKWMY